MFDIRKSEAQRLLADLIAIDSVNPSLVAHGEGEETIAQYLLHYMRGLDLPARLDEVVPGRPNVVGVLPATSADSPPTRDPFGVKHGIILNGHLDTVGTEGMEGDPLEARLDGDRMYGRGGYDMKGGLVMGLLAMLAIKRAGIRLRRSVLFTGVVDEEYASVGTEDVVKRYEAETAVVMEPTALSLHLAHKGFAWATVETFGHAAHGSDYWNGIDAIAQMGRVIVAVDELGRGFAGEENHPLVGRRSVHSSLVQGGKELSTYPDYCKGQFERRTLPAEDPRTFTGELETLCERLAADDPDFQYRVSLDFTRQGYEISPDEPIVKSLEAAVREVTGKEPEHAGSTGWLDSALLGAAGIPTVIFGPDGAGAHSAIEYVTLDSIVEGAQILAETIVGLYAE